MTNTELSKNEAHFIEYVRQNENKYKNMVLFSDRDLLILARELCTYLIHNEKEFERYNLEDIATIIDNNLERKISDANRPYQSGNPGGYLELLYDRYYKD